MEKKNKFYIGDSIYITINGPFDIILTTENGLDVTNKIHLEAHMFTLMTKYIEKTLSFNNKDTRSDDK